MNVSVIYLEIHFVFAGKLCSKLRMRTVLTWGPELKHGFSNHIPCIVKLRIPPVFCDAYFSVPNVQSV